MTDLPIIPPASTWFKRWTHYPLFLSRWIGCNSRPAGFFTIIFAYRSDEVGTFRWSRNEAIHIQVGVDFQTQPKLHQFEKFKDETTLISSAGVVPSTFVSAYCIQEPGWVIFFSIVQILRLLIRVLIPVATSLCCLPCGGHYCYVATLAARTVRYNNLDQCSVVVATIGQLCCK